MEVRILNKSNIEHEINQYYTDIHDIGRTIANKTGLELLISLKREKLNHGRYPDVTLFEAANRIMSDLVIYHGVRMLLKSDYPFDEYKVELGNENNNTFDIEAECHGKRLAGEAFNVASSFFQVKKNACLKKLRIKASDYDYRIIVFNSDAISQAYSFKAKDVNPIVIDIFTKEMDSNQVLNLLKQWVSHNYETLVKFSIRKQLLSLSK